MDLESAKQAYLSAKSTTRGAIGSFSDWISQNAQSLYHDNISTRNRMFLRGLSQDTTPIDQSYFQPQDLAAMRQMVGLQENFRNDPRMTVGQNHLKMERDPDGRVHRSGDMYTGPQGQKVSYDTYDSANAMGVPSSVTQPLSQQLGQFNYSTDPNGNVVVHDRYDFNPYTQGQAPGLMRTIADTITSGSAGPMAGYLGTRFIPSDGRHGYPVNVNLGNPNTWQR